MPITGIYTKDFPDLGRDAGEADLIPIAEVGNIVTKKTPVSGLITSARVVGALGFTPYGATPGTVGKLAMFGATDLQNSLLSQTGNQINLGTYAAFGVNNPGTPGDPGVDNDAWIGSIINNDFLVKINNVEALRIDTALRLKIANIPNATTDTDKFLVSDGGVVKYRTGAELLSDIGGASASAYVTLATTQTITGLKTFSLDTIINGINIGRGGGNGLGNTRVGLNALANNTIGINNTAIGAASLEYNIEGFLNVAIGSSAGSFIIADQLLTSCTRSVFIGANSRALDNNQTNQIVIGDSAIGLGSNTATLGNTSITITRLRGEVRGGSFVKDGGTSSQFLKADGSVDSNSYLPLSGGTLASSGSANTLNINHTSGSGLALNILKNGNGEGLTIVKGSGSGNAASITGGITLLSELSLTTKLADAHINSAAVWNAKIGGSGTTNFLPKFTASGVVGNSLIYDNGTNVGIGTTSPNVSGIEISRNTGDASPIPAELRISTSTNASAWSASLPWGRLSFYSNDTSVGGPKIHAALDVISTGSTGGLSDLVFSLAQPTTGSLVERMRILATGNVGINTTSPTSRLHVTGLPEYATNALAITGGLTVGAFYHTAGTLKVVI